MYLYSHIITCILLHFWLYWYFCCYFLAKNFCNDQSCPLCLPTAASSDSGLVYRCYNTNGTYIGKCTTALCLAHHSKILYFYSYCEWWWWHNDTVIMELWSSLLSWLKGLLLNRSILVIYLLEKIFMSFKIYRNSFIFEC